MINGDFVTVQPDLRALRWPARNTQPRFSLLRQMSRQQSEAAATRQYCQTKSVICKKHETEQWQGNHQALKWTNGHPIRFGYATTSSHLDNNPELRAMQAKERRLASSALETYGRSLLCQ